MRRDGEIAALRAEADRLTAQAESMGRSLSQSLDVNADWDHFYRELAPVLDAARELRLLSHEADLTDHAAWSRAWTALRAALAALPVPPVERGRAVLQTNGRSLAWPGEGEG